MTVLGRAQRLGLVAPFVLREWDEWWQQTDYRWKRPAKIRMSRSLHTETGRKRIARNYGMPVAQCKASTLLAHELGHAFQHRWAKDRKVAPLARYRRLFNGRARFRDPWNDLLEYRERRPDFTYDQERYISWYAWSDPDEDFAETFAEVIRLCGDVDRYRPRIQTQKPTVYSKLRTIVDAGQSILQGDAVLRACNDAGARYLFGGQIGLTCPATGQRLGVPDAAGSFVCPCGEPVIHDGHRVKHGR